MTQSQIEQLIHYELFTFKRKQNNTYKCSLNINYTAKGKVVFPSIYNNLPISEIYCEYVSEEINGENISMSVFTKNSEITHIFFLDNNNIVSIAENTFDGLETLIYFDFDKLNQLKRIESAAFRKTRLDPALGKEDTVIEYFGANLEFIGNFAFNQALTSSKSGKTLMIPPSVKTIESYGISNTDLPNHKWNIQIGNANNFSILNFAGQVTTPYKEAIRENKKYENFIFYSSIYSDFDAPISSDNNLFVSDMFYASLDDDSEGGILLGRNNSLITNT